MGNKEMRGGWLGIDWWCTRGESNKQGIDSLCCVNVRDFIRYYVQKVCVGAAGTYTAGYLSI